MGLANPIRDFKRPTLKQQRYTGTVVDNNDPLKQQRIKQRIPLLHRNVPDKDLPWVAGQQSERANAGGGKMGSVSVPPKGSKMYSRMDADNPYNSYYSGSPATDDVNKDHEIKKEDYPNSYGNTDQAGNKESVNTATNTRTYTHKKGTTIHVASDGALNFYSPTDITMSAKGRIVGVSKQDMKMHSKGGNNSQKGKKGVDQNSSDPEAQQSEVAERERPVISGFSGNMTA